MNAPNQALVAAAPIILSVLDELATFVNTVLTGDPAQILIRVDGAAKVLVGNIELQLPGLATSEIGVVKTDITGGLASLKAKVQNLLTTVPAAAPAAK
jgi:hypothetical protein